MTAELAVLCLLLTAGYAPVDTRFVEEAPARTRRSLRKSSAPPVMAGPSS